MSCILKYIMCFTLFVLAGTSSVAASRSYEPVYYPGTNSYFDLIRFPGQVNLTWLQAKVLAEQQSYKGARGRLAVIPGEDVNGFLRQTFTPTQEAWIGLRYWCPYLKLQWVTGDFLTQADYTNWHPYWVSDPGSDCAVTETTFMPVYYTPHDGGFLWQASSVSRRLSAFFIEYPMDTR